MLLDYSISQATDGIGERFEQQEFNIPYDYINSWYDDEEEYYGMCSINVEHKLSLYKLIKQCIIKLCIKVNKIYNLKSEGINMKEELKTRRVQKRRLYTRNFQKNYDRERIKKIL